MPRPNIDWPSVGDVARLTSRQRAVLTGVAVGMTDKEIGVSLSVSALTIKNHVAQIKMKLGMRDLLGTRRARLAAAAAKAGLV